MFLKIHCLSDISRTYHNQPIKSQIDHPSLKWLINHLENGFSGFSKWVSDSKSSSKWLRDSRSLMNQSDWSWADTLPEAKHLHNISVLKSPRASGRSSSEEQFPHSRWNRNSKRRCYPYHLDPWQNIRNSHTLRPWELIFSFLIDKVLESADDNVKSFI